MAYSSLERCFPNPAVDWVTFRAHRQLSKDIKYIDTADCKRILEKARLWLKENITKLQKEYPPDTVVMPSTNTKKKSKDNSVYIGAGGNAYLHWKLSRFYSLEGDEDRACEHLMRGLEAIHTALMLITKRPEETGLAFYIGAPGLYALAVILYHQYNEPVKTENYLTTLLSFLPECLIQGTPDELLFGRAGYLSCLLLVRKYLPAELCRKVELERALRQVFDILVSSGQQGSGKERAKKYLHYYFYGSDYLGAAHGTAGILYMLLELPEWCKEPETKTWILATLENLLSTQLPSGNFPPKDSGRRDDMLVHWCHGAPGIVPLLYKAFKVFGEEKYLKSMETGLQCIWKYGILKKGFGTCHGIAGNAYPFLCLYRYTGEEEYFYKALQMASCCWSEEIVQAVAVYRDPQRFKIGVPDSPYSLMEGLAGTVCFFCDLLHPEQAAFPGYDGEF